MIRLLPFTALLMLTATAAGAPTPGSDAKAKVVLYAAVGPELTLAENPASAAPKPTPLPPPQQCLAGSDSIA